MQILLEQRCACGVQVDFIQLQYGHRYPKERLVHGRVLAGKTKLQDCTFRSVPVNAGLAVVLYVQLCPPRSRFCPQPHPFQQNRCSREPAVFMHLSAKEQKGSEFGASPQAIPSLFYSIPCLQKRQVHPALHQTGQERGFCSQFESTH